MAIEKNNKFVSLSSNLMKDNSSISREDIVKARKMRLKEMADSLIEKRLATTFRRESVKDSAIRKLEENLDKLPLDFCLELVKALSARMDGDLKEVLAYINGESLEDRPSSTNIQNNFITTSSESDPRKELVSNDRILEAINIIRKDVIDITAREVPDGKD